MNEVDNSVTLCCIESRIETNRNFYGRFQLGPFDGGQGLTLANALRRTLLSELSGLAIVAVEIEGAGHEYSTIKGVRESVLDLLLNLKQIILTSRFQINQPQFGYLQVQGPGIVKAGDLKLPLSLQCVDPEQYIATLSYDGFLSLKFFVCQGKNYVSFSDLLKKIEQSNLFLSNVRQSLVKFPTKNTKSQVIKNSNILPIDAVFMTVNKVNYLLESYYSSRLGKSKERLILEIWTNGSIHPRQAIHEGSKILVKLFFPFQETKMFKSFLYKSFQNDYSKKENLKKIITLDIGNLDLSLRSYTCLKRAKIHTINDLLQYSAEELLLLKNFGKRSLEEVVILLQNLGFHLKEETNNDKN